MPQKPHQKASPLKPNPKFSLTITYCWFVIFRWERKLKDFRLSTIFRNCCLSFRSSPSASCSLVFSEGSWELSGSFLLYFFWVRQGGY